MILVVAWDGAGFDLVRPMVEAGDLPVLASLLAEGASRELESTVPAVTFPAWSSFLTAAGPDRHGLTDFTRRDGYSVRFMNATHRRLSTMFALLDGVGRSAASYGVPCTFPPDDIDGLIVCGFDTPLGGGRLGQRSHPLEMAPQLEARYGGLAVDGPQQSRIEIGWHDRALRQMQREIVLRTDIVTDLLRERRFGRDLFMVHYGESDTVSHQFWQFGDARSPRHVAEGPSEAIGEVYRALDRALGRLLAALPENSSVMVVSDHGSGGASDRVIHWNRWLADHGWLEFSASGGSAAMRLARRAALALIPPAVQAGLFKSMPGIVGRVESSARLGGIDWNRTRVFSEELNYFPALWLNRRGREPQGTIDDGDLDRTVEQLRADLKSFVDPFDGQPVVSRVLRREEIYDGPYAESVPDLVLELRDPDGYSYAAASSRGGRETESLRRMRPDEMTGARGTTMPGAHRRRGLCVLHGCGVRPGRYAVGSLADAGATVLALAGVRVPQGADGRPWDDVIRVPDVALDESEAMQPSEVREYGDAEAAEVARRLRALGYVE
jgi:predicted AlkP superfamily phosphohydrolase/phosphomutase